MSPRPQLPPADRAARSRLLRLLAAGQPLARASLVTMARTCGKPGCHCAQGQKHVSLYLAARLGRQRKMLYVPPDLEQEARRLVENAKAVDGLLDQMSQTQLEGFVRRKAGARKESRP